DCLGQFGLAEMAEYVSIDAQFTTAGVETEDDIVSNVLGTNNKCEELESDPESNPADVPPVMAATEALVTIYKLKLWLILQVNYEPELLHSLDAIESLASKCHALNAKQTQITDCFARR
ncbi:unnamed protein product, partial [Allacma fusca]